MLTHQFRVSELGDKFVKFIRILMIMSTIQIATLSVSAPPLSFYDYGSNLAEGGKVVFIKGTAIDNDVGTNFNSTYTVPLQRIKNLNANSYFVVIGFKHISIDIPTASSSVFNYMILVQNQTATSFGCLAWASYDPFFTRYEISYMAISREIGNVHFFDQMCIVNQALVYPAPMDFTFTDNNIKQTGRPYVVVQSIYQFALGYTAITPNALVTYVLTNSSNTYTVRLYSEGLYISTIGVQGVLFDPIILNDVKRKHIILYAQYAHPVQNEYFQGQIYSYPGISLSNRNVFFGLFFFYTASNKLDYKLNLSNNQVRLIKFATCPSLTINILVHLRNHCPDPFTYIQAISQCMPCMDNCLKCDGSQCFECDENFTLSQDSTVCQCQKQMVSGICYQFDQSPLKGCISAEKTQFEIKCKMCSSQLKLILTDNQCKCIDGYQFDPEKKCTQICGDSKIIESQCDDGNSLDGDGCSSTCKFESGFKCESAAQPSSCKFKQELKFIPLSIIKSKNNSATIKFGTDKIMLFDIFLDQLQENNENKMFNLSMAKNGSFTQLETHLMSVQNNQITFLINYNSTIQCVRSLLFLNLSNTKYTPQSTSVEFSMCGDNEPLQISEHWETFLKTQTVYNAFGILILVLLFIGLCTPKFIGLEAILTLQLIFYSCLLIKDVNSFPVGFKTFTAFKFSTGFNDLFAFTSIFLYGSFQRKIVWMGLQKTVAENYNVSFGLLILAMVLMVGSVIYRLKKQEDFDGRFANFTKDEMQTMQLRLSFSQKVNETMCNLMSQISYWSILQVIAAISIQSVINNKNVEVLSSKWHLKLGSLMSVLAIILIYSVGLNNFWNIILSTGSWGRLLLEKHVINYKQVKFLYLVVMGVIIFPLNQILLLELVPISVMALVVHMIYMIILYRVDPYKTSLKIHKYGLFISEFTLFLFLVVVNLANFLPKFPETNSLVFVYFIVAVCVIIVIFTIIRLYYEYKYGSELQIKIKKEREIQQFKKNSEQQNQLQRKLKKLEAKIQQKISQRQKQKLQNQFIYQNQLRQDLMNDQIEFIDKRPNITEEKREILYYEKFATKPLSWLQKNNVQEYNKVVDVLELKKAQEIAKRKVKQSDPEYIKVKIKALTKSDDYWDNCRLNLQGRLED